MDPSCTIGFLCSSKTQFHSLREQAEKVLAPPLQKGVYPFFSFSDQCLEDVLEASVNMRLGSFMDDFMFGEPSPQGKKSQWWGRKGDNFSFHEDEDFVVVECLRTSSSEAESEMMTPTGALQLASPPRDRSENANATRRGENGSSPMEETDSVFSEGNIDAVATKVKEKLDLSSTDATIENSSEQALQEFVVDDFKS